MSHAPSVELDRRHRLVRGAFGAHAVDLLVITSLPNITYLTNFVGSSAVVVLAEDRLYFLTDSRYVAVVTAAQDMPWACPDSELVVVDGSYDAALGALLARLGARNVGVEAAHLSVSRYRWLQQWLDAHAGAPRLVPLEGIVEAARVVKGAYEIDIFREAGRRLTAAATHVLGAVAAGMTERELADRINGCLRDAGFEKPAFETIVASGPNAALPHARPTERRLVEGDLVVLDFGGVYDSYCVDLTRTVSVGRASSRSHEVFSAVRTAHDRAIAAVRPGQSRFDVDAAARDCLAAAGMAEAFGHGTGHGLGIEIHEDPRIMRRRPDVDVRDEFLVPGMVFTVEPGAYYPGWGGVRIEDDVLVTETGVELLTHVTTELLEIATP